MEQSTPRTTAATSWLLLICLLAVVLAGVHQARAQADSIGFISVDCGLPGTANSVDDTTKLSYAPDAVFTDAGKNHNISAQYITAVLAKRFYNVRSFPDGPRSCYTLRSLTAGLKYLVRAEFVYGNYDGLSRLPVFDLYLGVNFWTTVNITSADAEVPTEAIVVVPEDTAQVCLVNTGSGTPFISSLELRPLKSSIYPYVNATQGLVSYARANFAQADGTVRYPDDPYDRLWLPTMMDSTYAEISTTEMVTKNGNEDVFEVPSKVLQTAFRPRSSASNKIEFYWDPVPLPMDPTPRYMLFLHFSELQPLRGKKSVREFYINFNGDLWSEEPYTPPYLAPGYLYSTKPFWPSNRYNVFMNATANSTLPPIINAVEIYSVISTANVGTDSEDVSAISAIKVNYRVQKNWMGDPCAPKTLAWDGLTCSYAISSPPRITGLNISFGGLNGDISPSFATLKAIQYLDLSHNNLTGSIPDALSQLPSLKVLDVTSNQLSGSIPPSLLKRIQDGSLNIQYGDNPNLCTSADTCQPTKGKKSKLVVYIVIPVVLVVMVGLLVTLLSCLLRRKKQGPGPLKNSVRPQNEVSLSHVPPPQGDDVYPPSSLVLDNRRFTYKELEMITNNFQHVLGQGGFGKVYDGFLEDGTQVAVKLRSQTSNQGVREFLAEAQILTRIHHKNLVSMIGYCKNGQYMALVYEYMAEGTLQQQIAGKGHNGRCLTWRQRLRISLDSAHGLEYLHKGCDPPLIHRDVKATNILLNTKLEAKIADFGFSKAFNRDDENQIATNSLVGTPGYVDPGYQATMQPTTKSDVYSFGVVMLELVTGRQAILIDLEPTNIIQWVRRRLARGNVEDVVDRRMHGEYDVNSVWKVVDIALKCTMQMSIQRPTITEVVAQLQECLELEESRLTRDGTRGNFYSGNSSEPNFGYDAYMADSQTTDVSQISTAFDAFEIEQNFGKVPRMGEGPVAR